MQADFSPTSGSIKRVFIPDQVILDFGPFRGQRLYYEEQAASFVPFPQSGQYIPEQYVGKSNRQLWAEFRIAVGGEIAPPEAVTVPGIKGLIVPVS